MITACCSMIWQAVRIGRVRAVRGASARQPQHLGTVFLRQQTSHRRDLAHLHRVGVETGHHAAQPRHVTVPDQPLPAIEIPQVRLTLHTAAQPLEVAAWLVATAQSAAVSRR
jgi:hypothetical protein